MAFGGGVGGGGCRHEYMKISEDIGRHLKTSEDIRVKMAELLAFEVRKNCKTNFEKSVFGGVL